MAMSGLHSRRGALIVLEGCDRVGKTTQCKKLVDALHQRNIETRLICFPDRNTAIGGLINDYLKKNIDLTDKAIHLLFSANRWEKEPEIKDCVNNGVTLIVDRYVYSGVAFSATKEGMDREWCKMAETGLPKPDAVFFLTVSPEALSERGGFGNEIYETTEIQKKVGNNYLKMADDSWQVISADQDVDVVHQDILSRALSVIEIAKSKSLSSLW
ncbi:thymidylate kinase isoform X2 [Zootermopsis nevadensis]|nr:thymidylate kinase isoform X2 [Zootermopsis nevadensis]XP_021923659.1 thymidylate kinase isoform X2 [Zootermopsis nevadensis]